MYLCLPAQSGSLFCSSSHFICLVSHTGSPSSFWDETPRPGLVSLSRIWCYLTSFPPCGQMVHKPLTSCSICTLGSVRDLHCVQGDNRRDRGSLFFDLMPQSLSSPLLQNCLCTGTQGELSISLGADEASDEAGLQLRAKLHLSWCMYASAAGMSSLWGRLSHAAVRQVKGEYCYKRVFEIAFKKSLARVSAKPRFNT